MEERVYNGYVYRREGPNMPWQMVGPAQGQQSAPRGGVVLTDPYKARDEGRKDEDQSFQRQQLGYSAEDNERSRRKERISNAQALREEYSRLPEVKAYRLASQMAAAAIQTAPTPQGDLSLVYAFAKAMDPDSAVRDAESSAVTNSQPWFQSAVQAVKKQFGMDNAGSFTPEARTRLRQEILRSLASRKPLFDARRGDFADLAKANGLSPTEVLGRNETEAYAPYFRRFAENFGDDDNVVAGLIGSDPIKRAVPKDKLEAAGMGATDTLTPIGPDMQKEHAAYLAQHWGNIDPSDYAAFRINLDRKYGFGSDPAGYAAYAPQLNQYAKDGVNIAALPLPGVRKELTKFDQFRNNLLSDEYGIGAGVASGLNAAGFGIPSLLAPEQSQALREANPVSSLIGEIGGSLGGTGLTGGLLRRGATLAGEGAFARALSSPLAADIGYGAAYGATQADDPLYGAVGGGAGGFLGNRIGGAIGRSFPEITGLGGAIRRADEAVPTSAALRDEAGQIYRAAESTGERIGGDETLALNDRLSGVLSREGRLSPSGRITEVQPKVREAYQLAGDYAGEPMTPTQAQTVRSVIGDAVTSGDNSERRIARMLLGEFDDWTDGVAPEMASGLQRGREVASRYLQGDEIALARELADVRAGQFSNAGQGNALRTDFRQLDRQIAKGQQSFSPAVEEAIADVARGNPVSNALRFVGRFAPTGPVSAIPMMMAGLGGYGASGTAGGLGMAAAMGGTGYLARQLGQRLTNRSAQVAENLAYGGSPYEEVITALLENAANRGGHIGTALAVPAEERLLMDRYGPR